MKDAHLRAEHQAEAEAVEAVEAVGGGGCVFSVVRYGSKVSRFVF